MNSEATLEQIKDELTRIRELLEAAGQRIRELLEAEAHQQQQSAAPHWVGETFIL